MKILCDVVCNNMSVDYFTRASFTILFRNSKPFRLSVAGFTQDNNYKTHVLIGSIVLKFYDTRFNAYEFISIIDFLGAYKEYIKEVVFLSLDSNHITLSIYGTFFEVLAKHLDIESLKFRFSNEAIWKALSLVCWDYKNTKLTSELGLVIINNPNVDPLIAVNKSDMKSLMRDVAKYQMLT